MITMNPPLVYRQPVEELSALQWKLWIFSLTHQPDRSYFTYEGQRLLADSFVLLSYQSKWNFARGLQQSFDSSLRTFQKGEEPGPNAISLKNHAELIVTLEVASVPLLRLCKETQSVMHVRLPPVLQTTKLVIEPFPQVEEQYQHLIGCMAYCYWAEEKIERRLEKQSQPIIQVDDNVAM